MSHALTAIKILSCRLTSYLGMKAVPSEADGCSSQSQLTCYMLNPKTDSIKWMSCHTRIQSHTQEVQEISSPPSSLWPLLRLLIKDSNLILTGTVILYKNSSAYQLTRTIRRLLLSTQYSGWAAESKYERKKGKKEKENRATILSCFLRRLNCSWTPCKVICIRNTFAILTLAAESMQYHYFAQWNTFLCFPNKHWSQTM